MRLTLLIIALWATQYPVFGQFSCTIESGSLPEKVSNNAVCGAVIDGAPYLYSFGGIDSTKKSSGIHLRSFRYNIQTGQSQRLPDLPDTMGKIAAGASLIDSIIYIVGGYHVFPNGRELSSNKVHRFNINTNQFLEDADKLLRATDDHVQLTWKDSLLYVITGWSNTGNIHQVQVYTPSINSWSFGTQLPSRGEEYPSFGASGVTISDTILYFGGASSSIQGFGAQCVLRKGVINTTNPLEVEWSIILTDPVTVGYRTASAVVEGKPHWIGGSSITYNYDGIAYKGSGGVEPTNRDLTHIGGHDVWIKQFAAEVPMDLRGIFELSDTVKYIAGGMIANQEVTDKVYRLEWKRSTVNVPVVESRTNRIYPMPVNDVLTIDIQRPRSTNTVAIYDIYGTEVILRSSTSPKMSIDVSAVPAGWFIIEINEAQRTKVFKN